MNRKSILSGFLNLFLLSMLLVAFFSGVSSHAAVSEAEWSMFQHDAAHTGYSSSSLPANIVSLWNASASSAISDVAVAQNYVYFISRDKIFALNASNGKSVWSSPSSSSDTDKLYNIIYECPAIVDGYVYTKYCAYNASTGQLLLDYTRNGVYGSPTVAEGVLLINTNFGDEFGPDGLIALNAKTGVKTWDFNEGRHIKGGNGHMPGFRNNPPAIANGVVYFSCASGVYAFNVKTGAQIWRVPIDGFGGYVTVADGNVFCSIGGVYHSDPDVLYCFDASTGHSKWTCQTAYRQPSVANGIVYVGSNALNVSTGKLIWNNTLRTYSQAIAGDIVYSVNIRQTSHGGEYSSVYEIHALNASTGNEEGIYSLGHLQNGLNEFPRFPAIANGTLYISQSVGEYDSSRIFCLGSAQPSSNSSPEPTSTPYHDPQQIEPVILGVAITVAVLAIASGLLIYLIKRK